MQRYKFKDYALHGTEKGSPALGVDGFPLFVDMNTIRKVVKFDEKSKKISRDISESALWDGVVKAAALGYGSTPVCSLSHTLTFYFPLTCTHRGWLSPQLTLESFIEREKGSQAASTAWDPRGFQLPAFVASSIGDIDSFGYLSKFSPRVQKNEPSSLTVEEIWQSDRMTEPVKMAMSWQWDGRMIISVQTGAKYVSQKAMDAFMATLKEWVDIVSA